MAKEKLLLWDFDWTLAYRDGMWSQSLYDLLLEAGFDSVNYDAVRPYMSGGFPWNEPEKTHEEFFGGTPWWEHMTAHFAGIALHFTADEAAAAKVAQGMRGKYLDITKWRLFEDTLPALQKTLSLGYKNIIVSNHVPELPELVCALGLSEYFTAVYSSAALGVEKPNPWAFRMALRGFEEPDAIMIGDNIRADVQGALRAGLDAILVRKENVAGYQKYSPDLQGIFKFL